jgi:hypothetical protein
MSPEASFMDISLVEQPSHGSVKRVRRIQDDWVLMKLGWAGIKRFSETNPETNIRDLKLLMFDEDPELMVEFMDLQSNMGEYQTIMLVTGWNLQKTLKYAETAPEQEYRSFVRKCIDTLGGTAADFFGGLCTDTSSLEAQEQTSRMKEELKNSSEGPSLPSQKPEEPSGQPKKEKRSLSPRNSMMS